MYSPHFVSLPGRPAVSDNLVEKEDLVSLKNGCVCCSLRQDIVKAFAEIEKRSCFRGELTKQMVSGAGEGRRGGGGGKAE